MPTHLESTEAELSVLGGILLDNAALDRVSAILLESDFHQTRHQLIYRHMLALGQQCEPIDPVTLATSCERAGELEAAGGIEFLTTLPDFASTAVNIEHHASIVHDHAEVRRLIAACEQIAQTAKDGAYEDSSELFDTAQQSVYEIGQARQAKTFTPLSAALAEVVDRAQEAYKTKVALTGTPTGYYDLDRMTSGFQAGDLIILAARPSMGKTAFALNLATAASSQQMTVAVFSLEMPTVQLATRILAAEARVESEKMRTGRLEDDEITRMVEASTRMNNWSLYIDDSGGISVMELRSKCRQLASNKAIPPLGLVVIDYLQLMHGAPNLRSHREQEISDISRNLKALAKELSVPVIALSQLNRSLEARPNKRPMMSDLRESGAIEQDADVILFVYRDEVYNKETEEKGVAEIIIGKQRNGPIGTVKLRFFNQWTLFANMQKEEEA